MKSSSNIAWFRFYEELNDYLPQYQRKRELKVELTEARSLRNVIIYIGVPLSDIDLILVNGISVDFEYVLESGDRVSVYPVFERLNIREVTRLRETPLRKMRFVADTDLEAMANQMNRSGLDTTWLPHVSDPEIRTISNKEKRIILTKRKALVQLTGVTHAVLIRSQDTEDQVWEVMNLLDIETPESDVLR